MKPSDISSNERELPFSRRGWGNVPRQEPSSHEFLARKHAVLFSIAVILYIGVGGTLKAGEYGVIEIKNAFILETALWIAFLWSVYRFRVICFERFQDFQKKACYLAEQHLNPNPKWSWLNIEERFKEAITNLDEHGKKRVKSFYSELQNIDEPRKLTFRAELHTYSGGKAEEDLKHGSTIWVYATRIENSQLGNDGVQIAPIHIDASETRKILFRAYGLLIRWDDSFSEWIVPWILIVGAFFLLYFRIGSTIYSAA